MPRERFKTDAHIRSHKTTTFFNIDNGLRLSAGKAKLRQCLLMLMEK